MKYSFLVPVYNGQDYIVDCLKSVVSQNTDDYELLVINDGSTDNTANLCEEFAKAHTKCYVISKPNEGLLQTRRFGLRYARGEWIIFVDADDFIESNYITTLEEYMDKNQDADLFIIANRTITDQGDLLSVEEHVFADGQVFKSKQEKYWLFKQMAKNTMINVIWGKVAKRSVYDIDTDYSKYGRIKGEDVLQSIPLLDNANKVVYCDRVLYNYRLSASGLGRNLKSKYVFDYSTVYETLFQYICSNYNDKEILSDFYFQYSDYLIRLLRALPRYVSLKEYKCCVSFVSNNELFRKSFKQAKNKSMQIQRTMEIGLPSLFYFVVRLFNRIVKH